MALTISSATLIERDVVEVHASGARGGKQEWTVHYDRHAKIAYCFQHAPSGGYTPAHQAPQEIKEAAWKVYRMEPAHAS